MVLEMGASACMMADACHIPHVVHDPCQGFSEFCESLHSFQAEHSLVDPSEKDGVGFTYPRMIPDGESVGGGVYFEEGGTIEAVVGEDVETFF